MSYTPLPQASLACFGDQAGDLTLDKKTLTNLAVACRDMGYNDLMLVSFIDRLDFIVSKPRVLMDAHDGGLYLRQRLNDEHNPQNGQHVLLALRLDQSIDEQWYAASNLWEPATPTFRDLDQSQVTLAQLAETPIIADGFEALKGELLPDLPSGAIFRHSLPEVLADERRKNLLEQMDLPVSRMIAQL